MADVEVPEENVLGRVEEGFKIAMFGLDQGLYTVARKSGRPSVSKSGSTSW